MDPNTAILLVLCGALVLVTAFGFALIVLFSTYYHEAIAHPMPEERQVGWGQSYAEE